MSSIYAWAQTSPADDFWLVASILVILAIAGFFGAFYCLSRKRTMENTPTSRIRSAAQGYVELQGLGKFLEGPPILGPLTGKYCTWYSYSIEAKRRSGKETRWVTVERGVSDQLFLIEDDTGQCVIDPDGASVTPGQSDTWYGKSSRPDSGPQTSSGFMNMRTGNYRYTEKRMHPGEALYAIGLFSSVGGAGGDFNMDADVRELLREWKQDSDRLIQRFDKDGDGELDMREWQNAREQAFAEVMARHSEMKTAPPVNMLTRTRDRRRPFILSAIPQEVMIKRLGYYSIGLILIFFTLGSLAAWIINIRITAT